MQLRPQARLPCDTCEFSTGALAPGPSPLLTSRPSRLPGTVGAGLRGLALRRGGGGTERVVWPHHGQLMGVGQPEGGFPEPRFPCISVQEPHRACVTLSQQRSPLPVDHWPLPRSPSACSVLPSFATCSPRVTARHLAPTPRGLVSSSHTQERTGRLHMYEPGSFWPGTP